MNGKGDLQRPAAISEAEVAERWAETFTKEPPLAEQYPHGYFSCACPISGRAHDLQPERMQDTPGQRVFRCTQCELRVGVAFGRVTPPIRYGPQPVKRATTPAQARRAFRGGPATYNGPEQYPLDSELPETLLLHRDEEYGDIIRVPDGRLVMTQPLDSAHRWLRRRWYERAGVDGKAVVYRRVPVDEHRHRARDFTRGYR